MCFARCDCVCKHHPHWTRTFTIRRPHSTHTRPFHTLLVSPAHFFWLSHPGGGVEAAGMVVPPPSMGGELLQGSPEPAPVWTHCSVGACWDHCLRPVYPTTNHRPPPWCVPPQLCQRRGAPPAAVSKTVSQLTLTLFLGHLRPYTNDLIVFSRFRTSSTSSGTNREALTDAAAEACEEEDTDECVCSSSTRQWL